MLQITCPSCNRALSLPETMQGQQVQCPLCRNEFRAGGNGPPPVPAAADPYGREGGYPPPRSWDRDDREAYPPYEPTDPAARSRSSAAVWLMISGIVDVLVLLVFYLLLFTADRGRSRPPVDVITIISLMALLFYVAPLIFIFLAAGTARNPNASGLVIAGSVMTFILALEHLFVGGIVGIVWIEMVSGPFRRAEPVPPAVPILALLCLIALVFSILAGVKGLIAASQGSSPRRRPRYDEW
jgi:hypothetical protein